VKLPFALLPAAGACLCAASLAGAAQTADAVVFTDVTEHAGVAFTHSFGDDDMSSILEATGSGCLFFDYDADGLVDLYAVNGRYLPGISEPEEAPDLELTNHLFRNIDGARFADVTVAAAVGDTGYGMACIAGDYDNDGATDLYVTNYGANALYHNDGKGAFADVTAVAGVGDTLWGVGTTFLDYDNDGDLDLFVGNYLEFDPEYRLYYAADKFPGPLSYPGQPDVLYRNNGEGSFTIVSAAAGVLNDGRAMGVVAADYDLDGHIDLFVANDAMGNYLYHNRGDGTFEDVALYSGVAFSASGDKSSSMGGDFGDFDNDGDFDLLVPDMAYNNFYVNGGAGEFEDATAALGIAEVSGQYVSWNGDFFDYDNDGDLDIFILHLDQPSMLLRNDGGNSGHWLAVELEGTRSNRDAFGTLLRLRVGGTVQLAEKLNASGYLAQNDPRVHFGLGPADIIDTLEVRWPSGARQHLTAVPADQVLTLREPGE